ncbi:SPT10 (YJL127C) [Zygosaccharomyces parabailii]|nr:SPT10 (YJL127C) [Zygosaccharomyces parabailii]
MNVEARSFNKDDNQEGSHVEDASEENYQEHVLTPLQPHTILLKDGETVATMYPIAANPELLPAGLLTFLLDEFNMEIEKGGSFPYYEKLSLQEFKNAWFHPDGHVCIMVLGEIPELDYSMENNQSDLENNYGTDIETMRRTAQYKRRKERRNLRLSMQWEKQCLGIFSLQPAYPGRSSHVVTGTFLVNAGIRGKRIGRTLVETFVEWAKRLGFTSSYFPLIYGTNVGIRRILEGLNFKRIGRLPESGILKGFDVPVDSFIYGKEFTHITKSIDLLRDPQRSNDIAKYERLKYYLETGKYPPHCDRNEKARLRVSSKTHSVANGKLMARGREIIYEPERQRQIAMEMHLVEHQGINKITTRIVEKYHWKGIKNTVSEVISSCQKCKLRYQDGVGVIVMPHSPVRQAHMLPNMHADEDMDHSSQLSQMAAAVVGSLQEGDCHSREETPVDEPMNAFNRFMEEEQARKKRRYLDAAANSLVPRGTSTTQENGSVIEGNLEDAMLTLGDNVMAAVQLVKEKEDERNIYYQ